MRHAIAVGGLILVALATGCSSSPPLQTESSTSAIRAAEAVGTTNSPRAALHLQLARESADQAKVLADKGEKDEAKSLLTRAEVDAELAVLLAREQNEKTDAARAMEQVRQLQQDNK